MIQIPLLLFPHTLCSTDEERTCYTGALCGLGWNSETQQAVLPEHNIELSFDVKVDVEDITEVTAVLRQHPWSCWVVICSASPQKVTYSQIARPAALPPPYGNVLSITLWK